MQPKEEDGVSDPEHLEDSLEQMDDGGSMLVEFLVILSSLWLVHKDLLLSELEQLPVIVKGEDLRYKTWPDSLLTSVMKDRVNIETKARS